MTYGCPEDNQETILQRVENMAPWLLSQVLRKYDFHLGSK